MLLFPARFRNSIRGEVAFIHRLAENQPLSIRRKVHHGDPLIVPSAICAGSQNTDRGSSNNNDKK
jgi:hypothetical protein